jgi:hypothetical protein
MMKILTQKMRGAQGLEAGCQLFCHFEIAAPAGFVIPSEATNLGLRWRQQEPRSLAIARDDGLLTGHEA